MKKVSLFLVFVLLSLLTACGKDDDAVNWEDEDNYVDVIESDEKNEDIDLNLTGELYTAENKPDGSEEITVYTRKENELNVEPHTSYALPENINIDYLLKVISAFSTKNTMKFSGYVVEDIATVDVEALESFLPWLNVAYPNDLDKYSPPVETDRTDVVFNADGFAMVGLEIIDRTLKANLGVKTVVFKAHGDQDFLTFEKSPITDGVFFTEDSSPLYIGSQYNFYNGMVFTDYIKSVDANGNGLSSRPIEEQLSVINQNLVAPPTGGIEKEPPPEEQEQQPENNE